MTEYVLVYPRIVHTDGRNNENILLVTKGKPAWQAGRLNLVGGKVEAGETIAKAASRELMEESGLGANSDMEILGKIIGIDCVIHCCVCKHYVFNHTGVPNLYPRDEETEEVHFYPWSIVKDDPRLMPNLQVIIPLLSMGVKGWSISDKNTSILDGEVKVQLSLNPFETSNEKDEIN